VTFPLVGLMMVAKMPSVAALIQRKHTRQKDSSDNTVRHHIIPAIEDPKEV